MSEINLNAAKKFDSERQFKLEKVRIRFPEMFIPGGPPEEHLFEICPFLFDKPQTFYHEGVFENTLKYLTDYYNQYDSSMVDHFSYVAESWRTGALNTEQLSKSIEFTVTDHLNREARIQEYWCLWYQNLVETCLKNLCSPLIWTILQSEGKNINLENDMPYMSNRADVLNKQLSLQIITKDFNATVRNGCAHGGVSLLENQIIQFHGVRGSKEDWTEDEFLSHIHGILDVCNALIFATTVFIFRNWAQLASIFSYHALPANQREKFFLADASTPAIEVKEAGLKSVIGSKLQATVHATDQAFTREELIFDSLAILQRIARFYPDADTVFLGLKGPRHLASWIRVPMPALHEWANGVISVERLFTSSDAELMIPQFKQFPLARRAAVIRRGLGHGIFKFKYEMRKAKQLKTRPWDILEIQDKSIGLAKRLDVTLLIQDGLSKREIESLLIEATNYVREKRYRTEEKQGFKRSYRKYTANRPAGYVWLTLFTKEKRPSDMRPNEAFSYYVCRTEWFDDELRNKGLTPILHLPDRVGQSQITVEWASRYLS